MDILCNTINDTMFAGSMALVACARAQNPFIRITRRNYDSDNKKGVSAVATVSKKIAQHMSRFFKPSMKGMLHRTLGGSLCVCVCVCVCVSCKILASTKYPHTVCTAHLFANRNLI
jgi:hypothetical protein